MADDKRTLKQLRAEVRAFDKLPRDLRRVLADASVKFDARDIRKAWDARRRAGYTTLEMAEEIERTADRAARHQGINDEAAS